MSDRPQARGTCEASGRAQYSRTDADRLAARKRRRKSDHVHPYRCGSCPWWHLAHRTFKGQPKHRRRRPI